MKSIQTSHSRCNTLPPIFRLPFEILSTIFALLSESAWDERAVHLEWIRVAHVCRRWREAALNYPRFWSYINFTKLAAAGLDEILARAKMAPLHLEGDVGRLGAAQVDEAFGRQLEAHISHTHHLSISGDFESVLVRLLSSAPTLDSLSLTHGSSVIIPDNIFNCAVPNLTNLELEKCDISWKSPLLRVKGLQNLQIHDISTDARPQLGDWLEALNEMPNLKTLSLQHATPLAPLANPLISEPSRIITLSFLTHFHIHALAKDCALALEHLLLPALTWLHVDVESHDREGEDMRQVIHNIARNVYVLQDIEPLQSILIAGERRCTEVYASAIPNVDVMVCGPDTLDDMSRSACFLFSAKGDQWIYGVNTEIFDSLLTLLPVNSVSTFTAQNRTRLSKDFWLRHAPRWPLLEQARLVPTSVGAFTEMLSEDSPLDGPRLPSLTKLILLDVTLTAPRTCHLQDVLIKRVKQGVPLKVLDLRTCFSADRAIQSLAENVIDVQGPLDAVQMEMEDKSGKTRPWDQWDEVDYGYGGRPWYYRMEDEDGDGDEADEADELPNRWIMFSLRRVRIPDY